MGIILITYLALAWLVFSKFKLVKWGWLSGTVTVLIGAFIIAVFMAMFNYLTPSGSFVIVSRVVEVTPNVSGQVTAIPVQPNVPVKAGAVLFQIERAPYEYKVDQLQAALAEARQKVEQLKSNVDLAGADAEAIASQFGLRSEEPRRSGAASAGQLRRQARGRAGDSPSRHVHCAARSRQGERDQRKNLPSAR